MIRIRDIATTFVLAILAGFIAGAFGQDGQTEVTATLIRVTDADTLEGDVVMVAERGESLYWQVAVDVRPVTVKLLKQKIRVHGVDSPELKTIAGVDARNAVNRLIVGKKIKLTPRGKDSFGRLLAIVTLVDDKGKEIVLADWLIKNEHGVAYKP